MEQHEAGHISHPFFVTSFELTLLTIMVRHLP